jgi:hypothetical protein
MAYKLFSTGEVLTAANVNNYLMKQTVMVFADAATRTTALSGVLAEGMISYRVDAKVLEIYNGTTWVDFSGDITGVTAGTGLTGGGTSGTVTLTLDPTVPYGYSTTATAAGTTTLTATSNRVQMFTGTTTQTVVLPVASTMTLGQAFTIHNNSTGSVTVQSSGLNNVIVIPGGNTYQVTSILTSGTTAASWDADFTGSTSTTGSGSTVLNSAPTIDSPTVTGTLTAGGSAGTSGQYLQSTASGIQWVTASSGSAQVSGKNAVINGDFLINQRAFTSNTTTGTYNFDRWLQQNSGGTFTVTPQTFTPGAAPASTYESRTYFQGITATQSAAGDYAILTQRIEDVTRYAGTTVTVSFFAKANTGTPKIGVELQQNFGTGGSPSATVSTPGGAITLSTSWARYSVSIAVPSLSGKTLGTTANTSYLELNLWTSSGSTNATRASSIGIQNFTASIWGVQLEYGSSATYFTTATGSLQGEFAACSRYFQRQNAVSALCGFGSGAWITGSPTSRAVYINVPIPNANNMRTSPSISTSAVGNFQISSTSAGADYTVSAFIFDRNNLNYWSGRIDTAATPTWTAGSVSNLTAVNTSAYFDYSSEL